jgi:hypothetical protein
MSHTHWYELPKKTWLNICIKFLLFPILVKLKAKTKHYYHRILCTKTKLFTNIILVNVLFMLSEQLSNFHQKKVYVSGKESNLIAYFSLVSYVLRDKNKKKYLYK